MENETCETICEREGIYCHMYINCICLKKKIDLKFFFNINYLFMFWWQTNTWLLETVIKFVSVGVMCWVVHQNLQGVVTVNMFSRQKNIPHNQIDNGQPIFIHNSINLKRCYDTFRFVCNTLMRDISSLWSFHNMYI